MTTPDTFFPSDNQQGIPLLDIQMQANYFDLPIVQYGSERRKTQAGTVVFFVYDYFFESLWKKPELLFRHNPINICEPNFSIYKDYPEALALYQIYRKRWLSRYYQSQGIRVFVDLNVFHEYYELNLLGVPKGWSAYSTRGVSDRPEDLLREIEIAENHASPNPILFLCYGGGNKIKKICQELAYKNVYYVTDFVNREKKLKDKTSKIFQLPIPSLFLPHSEQENMLHYEN